MRIFCRVKPCKEDKNLAISFPEKEKLNIQNIRQQTNDSIKKTEVQLRTIEIAIQNQKKTIFFFDRVFDYKCSQNDVYYYLSVILSYYKY